MIFLVLIILIIAAYVIDLFSPKEFAGGHESNSWAFYKDRSAIFRKPIIKFEDIPHSLKYAPQTQDYYGVHIGQRKLFLNEVQFLTNHARNDPAFVVYAGAAPGNKTGLLSKLFPKAQFLLVDPNKFDIREHSPVFLTKDTFWEEGPALEALHTITTETIYIINGLFTIGLAKAIHKYSETIDKPVLFISDIRTSMQNGSCPTTMDIIWNSSQQFNWINAMKPKMSMLKFRLPFYEDLDDSWKQKAAESPYLDDFNISKAAGIDFVKNCEAKKFIYFKGDIFMQPWPGKSSTETRLVTDGREIVEFMPLEEYESKLFYYNKIERIHVRHTNENADRRIGFDYCNDCALENQIWKDYIELSGSERPVYWFVNKLSKITDRGLIREGHGKFFNKKQINQDTFKTLLSKKLTFVGQTLK